MADTQIENPTNELSSMELAAELTAAWLSNPNTRASAEEVPAFLKTIHDAINGLGSAGSSDKPAGGGNKLLLIIALGNFLGTFALGGYLAYDKLVASHASAQGKGDAHGKPEAKAEGHGEEKAEDPQSDLGDVRQIEFGRIGGELLAAGQAADAELRQEDISDQQQIKHAEIGPPCLGDRSPHKRAP